MYSAEVPPCPYTPNGGTHRPEAFVLTLTLNTHNLHPNSYNPEPW